MKKWMILAFAALWLLTSQAQTDIQAIRLTVEQLTNKAKTHTQQKEYELSNACYDQIIAAITGTELAGLAVKFKDMQAINHLYMGVAQLKSRQYAQAKEHMDKAIALAKPASKTYYMAHSWMGSWYSIQAQELRSNNTDLEQAVKWSLEAERYYNMGQRTDYRLKEQLARANALIELLRDSEAQTLLQQVIRECEGQEARNMIRGQALYKLGKTERDAEQYQQAILHLEQAYALCTEVAAKSHSANDRIYARLAAESLQQLYTSHIPDSKKAALWEQRANSLKLNDE